MKRQLILEDGTVLIGDAIGSDKETKGEVVFNTGMTGYQETLSDPSYCQQIITFTYPLIGNYGIHRDDFESISPAIAGVIVKSCTKEGSHFKSEQSLDTLLKEKGIPGIEGIDTRKLTKIIRKTGVLKGKIASMDADPEKVAQELRTGALATDQVAQVSAKATYTSPGQGLRVVLVDFGAKKGILRDCIKMGFDMIVVPHDTTAEEILKLHPDGVLLSNGPGDPQDVPYAAEMVKGLLGKVPVFGICLGHQLLGLACGATTTKMKFGHRGANHPVKDLKTGRFMMTSQNHGYTINPDTLISTDLEVTHIAINDESIEGLQHKVLPAFSVQFHPEASPGPNDSSALFNSFEALMTSFKKAGKQHA